MRRGDLNARRGAADAGRRTPPPASAPRRTSVSPEILGRQGLRLRRARTPRSRAGRRGRPRRRDPPRPRSLSTLATAQVVRRTTARFIPFGPPRRGPRRPAVPNVSGWANRSSSSSSLQRRQFGGGLRIGVVSDPLLRGRRGPRRSHTASVPALRFGVSQLAQHRRDEHQQVELQRRQVVAHGGVQPGVAFGAVGLQQRGARRGELDELPAPVGRRRGGARPGRG